MAMRNCHKHPGLLWLIIALLTLYITMQHTRTLLTFKRRDTVFSFGQNPECSAITDERDQLKVITEDLKQELLLCRGESQPGTKSGSRVDQTGAKSGSEKLSDKPHTGFQRAIPNERRIDKKVDIETTLPDFQRLVTVLIYGGSRSNKCILEQIKQIHNTLPHVKVIVAWKSAFKVENIDVIFNDVKFINSISGEGDALNKMTALVRTDYFLYLSRGDVVSGYNTEHSPGWLLRALMDVPELDVVGGSFLLPNSSLKYAQVDIQCYRMAMCYWTFRQTYEYRYSVTDMMVCEESSSSFMARTKVLSKIKFDSALDAMATTDFFLRGKGRIVAGLIPVVYFHVSKICQDTKLTPSEESLRKQSFMDKYSLKRLIDSFGRITDYPEAPKLPKIPSILPSFNFKSQGGVMVPQSHETLRRLLVFFDDFAKKYNVTYIVVAGVPLGGIKLRDVLPWDTGDIDTGFFGVKWETVLANLKVYAKERGVQIDLSVGNFPGSQEGAKLIKMYSLPHHHDVVNDIYSRQYLPTPNPDELMYIFIYDRYIPVLRTMFGHFSLERIYRITYLRNMDHYGKLDLRCTVPGHHACVPKEYGYGGGHWTGFNCR